MSRDTSSRLSTVWDSSSRSASELADVDIDHCSRVIGSRNPGQFFEGACQTFDHCFFLSNLG
jgi:hypothetical protein